MKTEEQKQKAREYAKTYYESHKEEIKQKAALYRKEHHQQYNDYMNNYFAQHKEMKQHLNKLFIERHPEYHSAYAESHKDYLQAKAKERGLYKYTDHPELVENYEIALLANFQGYCQHHRLEITEGLSRQQLIEQGRYYNVEPEDLIFMTNEAHMKLHRDYRKQIKEQQL